MTLGTVFALEFYCSTDRSEKGRVREGILAPKVTWGDGEFGEIIWQAQGSELFQFGTWEWCGVYPSLGSIGIMNLAGNVELNPGAQ